MLTRPKVLVGVLAIRSSTFPPSPDEKRQSYDLLSIPGIRNRSITLRGQVGSPRAREYNSSTVHVLTRPQRSRRTLSPSEYAAAGDAPRGQLSSVLNLVISPEIFTMDNAVLTTVTKDRSKVNTKLNDPCVYPSVEKIWSSTNDSTSFSTKCSPDLKLRKGNARESRFASRTREIEDNLDCRISFEREFRKGRDRCGEYSRNSPRGSNAENLANGEQSTTEHFKLTKVIAKNGEGDLRITNENYTVERILPPDRKTSMFSKEIWTEKVLPIDTFVCPEPELIEIYSGNSKMNNNSKSFGNYGTETIHSLPIPKDNNRGVFGRSVSTNRPSSVKKGRISSSSQKTINFDDEIWSVCPKLIPSDKELSISTYETRPEVISPEKLTENECSILKVANVLAPSSTSSSRQYDPEGGLKTGKLIEPTHETEGQNDFATILEGRKYDEDTCSPSTISQVNIAPMEKPRKSKYTDRILREPNSAINVIDRAESNNVAVKLSRPAVPSDEPRLSQRLTQVKNNKDNIKKSSESSPSRTLKKRLLSASNNEPVSTVLTDVWNRRENGSSRETRLPAMSGNEIILLDNAEAKHSNEDSVSSFEAPFIAKSVSQVSLTPVKNHEVVQDQFGESSTITCKVSREMDEPSQSSAINYRNKMHEMSAELNCSNQDTCPEIHVVENHTNPSHAIPSSFEMSAIESRNSPENVNKPEMEKKRKCAKVVRFKICDRPDDVEDNFTHRDVEASHSVSVESFKQEIDQLANQIARQIELDPIFEDAVTILAKIELIVEANRQAEEKLQQLQPNVTIPRLTPPDAGKLLAKALMRCRTHMQNNGYSHHATRTLNKLLTTAVQNLKQLVEKQKLTLVTRSKKRYTAIPHQKNSSNINGVLTIEEFGADQVQCLISDILILTEKIIPKRKENGFQRRLSVTEYYLQNETTNSSKDRTDTNRTSSPKESSMTLERCATSETQPVEVPEPKAKEVTKSSLEKSVTSSKISTDFRMGNDELSVHLQARQRADKEIGNTSAPRFSDSKKIASKSNDSTKTSRKLFNELCERRSKNFPRHYNVNDFVNHCQSRASSQNASTNQKLPAWKPSGNNFVQPSVIFIPNHPKDRPPHSSSTNKKKNAASEHVRDKKLHRHAKATPSIVKDPSKISQSVKKPYNTSSLAKIKSVPPNGDQSEVLSLDRKKVQVSGVVDETRTRKPRSKSRTRTRAPNVDSRLTVTEIPLEHANSCSPVPERKPSVFKEFPLTKKISSSPRDIIHMLEELIKSSSNDTSIHNISPVQIVSRCDDTVKNVDSSVTLKTDVKSINAIGLITSNEKNHSLAEESSQNLVVQSELIEKMIQKSKNTVETNDSKISIGEEKETVRDTLTEVDNWHKKIHSIPRLSAEQILTVPISRSNALPNCSTEGRTTSSESNVGYTAELSSEHSIDSVFSKCCQASLSSITSHEISEELICNQISESEVTSCREKMETVSQEPLNTIEDDKVVHQNFTEQFHDDRTTSTNSAATPKKKFVNKHAKSLEMLREILSDQGLGIHLLNRAENELKGRCKCGSSKGGLTAKRSLQSANFATSKFSGRSIDRVTLPYKNLSATLFGKLATLSESESDIEHVEVATMTLANDSTVSTNDCATSAGFENHCIKEEDKLLLDKVLMVETATQFDTTSKSDMCVGDGIICDTSVVAKNRRNHAHNLSSTKTLLPAYASTEQSHETLLVDNNELFKYQLPEDIFYAIRLAAVRANNFYTAVNILRENTLSESITRSNSALELDKIVTRLATAKSSSASGSLFNANGIGSDPVRDASTVSRSDEVMELHVQTEKSKTLLPVRKTTPRTRMYEKNKANVERVKPSKSVHQKKTFSTIEERTTALGRQSTDCSHMLTSERKSSDDTKIRNSAASTGKGNHESSLPDQEDSIKGCRMNGGEVEMLHFAKKRAASLVRTRTNPRLEEMTEANPRSSRKDFVSYGSHNANKKVNDLPVGSRIGTLLKKNLQLFETDYHTMMDVEKVLTDFGDQLLTESSDDEELIGKVFSETATSTSRIQIDDSNILLEVETLVECLLNKAVKNCETLPTTKYDDPNTHLLRHNRLRQPLGRLKSKRRNNTVKRSMAYGKYWISLSEIIVSREQILSLIYAAICSFVFCCLQLSVRCEV